MSGVWEAAERQSPSPTSQIALPVSVEPQRVVVVDFDMKFSSMIVFMIKWVLAAIPAALLLVLTAAMFSAFVGGLFR